MQRTMSQDFSAAPKNKIDSSVPEAIPFFMAGLFDQSAAFVAPSENAELVAAAERTQELIGDWLLTEAVGEKTLPTIISSAVTVLEPASAAPQISTESESDFMPPVLSDTEIAELRQFLAAMTQNNQLKSGIAFIPGFVERSKLKCHRIFRTIFNISNKYRPEIT